MYRHADWTKYKKHIISVGGVRGTEEMYFASFAPASAEINPFFYIAFPRNVSIARCVPTIGTYIYVFHNMNNIRAVHAVQTPIQLFLWVVCFYACSRAMRRILQKTKSIFLRPENRREEIEIEMESLMILSINMNAYYS